MDESLPYRVSYSDGEELCQKCQKEIRFGCLQIALMIQSNEDDCQHPTWFHRNCFFKTRRPATEAAFDGFSLLRYQHQKDIKRNLNIDGIENKSQGTTADKTTVHDFSIEYTKMDRGFCKDCTKPFKRGQMRIMQFVSDANTHQSQNDIIRLGHAHWYHVGCFKRLREELGWHRSGSLLPGFSKLSNKDKGMIERRFPAIESGEDEAELEREIQLQNEEYYRVYDYIVANLSKRRQIQILEFNRQLVPATDEQILHHLTDLVCFGALRSCSSCKRRQLMFRNWIYKCNFGSEWSTCGNEVKEPARYLLRIPPKLAGYTFLVRMCKVRKRAIHSFNFVDEQGNDIVHGPYKKPILFNMEFVLVGSFTKPRGDLERLIRKLGGKVGTEIHDRVAAVVSTAKRVRKMGKSMKKARKYNVRVVGEDFLDEIQKPDADPIQYINSKCISDWSGVPSACINENFVASQLQASFYTKSLPQKKTYKWKDGGAVVDPESGLEGSADVFCIQVNQKKLVYSVVLGFVDIKRNKNSYHRMQLLESDDRNTHWVFEAWGRTGTVIGDKRVQMFDSLTKALEKFNTVYENKTGNKFGMLTFQKQHNKFYRLDVEVGMPREIPHTFIASKLDAPVHDLMQMLFDIKKMENLMCSCELDLKQMPLGKISAKQIKMAMSALCSIAKLIKRKAPLHEFRDASNKYYTLIPHTFGVSRPPIIDTLETIVEKNEMLESLLNMETIYSFLESENGEKIHPLDACYEKLNASIVSIPKDSNEFQLLNEIVRSTQGPPGNYPFSLEVLDVFKVTRDGEDERFQQQLANHKLLWHGSRLMNFVSILSNGLKIAPKEAPVTGYAFGKGVYFADAVSKSAHYCFANKNNDTGLMLMCEVALGNSMQLTHSTSVENIPNTLFQSVKAVGCYFPSQCQYIDGVPAPFLGLSKSPENLNLRFNEFVIYDVAQVKIKYLFKMKFNFRY